MNFVQLGSGNILCHCEWGYHRGPVAAGLVWCALHNSTDGVSGADLVDLEWFLRGLSLRRHIDDTRPSTVFSRGSSRGAEKQQRLHRMQMWASGAALTVPKRSKYLKDIQEVGF